MKLYLYRILESLRLKKKLVLIHVGKCAGTFILHTFLENKVSLSQFHNRQPVYSRNSNYILWVRNPLSRFVSAFNFSYVLVNSDLESLAAKKLTFENSIAPVKLTSVIKNAQKYVFSEEYDSLIKYFKYPNNLAESLSSKDLVKQKKAIKLMTSPEEHIFHGLGWYLLDGEFLQKYYRNFIFVGRQEHMVEDLAKLSKKLNLNLKISPKKVRENKPESASKNLSSLAIRNLLDFYAESDYRALKLLYEKGLIGKETFDDYHSYPLPLQSVSDALGQVKAR